VIGLRIGAQVTNGTLYVHNHGRKFVSGRQTKIYGGNQKTVPVKLINVNITADITLTAVTPGAAVDKNNNWRRPHRNAGVWPVNIQLENDAINRAVNDVSEHSLG
jgi:hypothetical protein